jgi:hypothetical protein
MSIASIVEGEGDVHAVPILLRRILATMDVYSVRDIPPIRVSRSAILKAGQLERCQLGPELQRRAQSARPDFPCSVVLAENEYENWFLSAASSLAGKEGFPDTLTVPANPLVRDAKGWLDQRKQNRYQETRDQAKLTRLFDLELAKNNASFEKCCREIVRLAEACKAMHYYEEDIP